MQNWFLADKSTQILSGTFNTEGDVFSLSQDPLPAPLILCFSTFASCWEVVLLGPLWYPPSLGVAIFSHVPFRLDGSALSASTESSLPPFLHPVSHRQVHKLGGAHFFLKWSSHFSLSAKFRRLQLRIPCFSIEPCCSLLRDLEASSPAVPVLPLLALKDLFPEPNGYSQVWIHGTFSTHLHILLWVYSQRLQVTT